MDTITSIAGWLFLQSVYGIAVITALAYLLAAGFRQIIPNAPHPGAIGAIVFIAALFTVPSLPRYQFESDSLAEIEGKGWIRVINKTNSGSLTEPLTWFRAPVGSIFMIMPNSPIEGGYREVLLRYEDEPRVSMSEPDCSDKTILRSETDSEGVYRYTSGTAQALTEEEFSIYCEYDWSKEKQALAQEVLKHMKSE